MHQRGIGDAKTWGGIAEWMLSSNNAKQVRAASSPWRADTPRKTHPGDSDKLGCMGLDSWIISADQALRTLSGGAHASRAAPSAAESDLSPAERKLSGALLRVDHVGEVCAQALYQAQALTARDSRLRAQMQRAADEEVDHLAWTMSASATR